MLKREIKYINFNDEPVVETFYFNLSKTELVDMEVGQAGGMANFIQRIIDEKDNSKIIAMFKDFTLKAIGEKSEDGKRFIKTDEIRKNFEQSAAFEALYMELLTVEDAAVEFFNGCMPADLVGRDQDKPAAPPKIGDTRPANN